MIPTSVSTLVFYVNGKKIVDEDVNAEWTLLQYLRNKLRLCGTKLGCGEGGCGACTVMVSKYDRERHKVIHIPVNACLAPICSMHGLAVTTTEGIGSTRNKLHPVQERIAKAHGSQCGFCTPGIVMSMYTLLRQMPRPTMKAMEVAFQGNLCRCTGYRPIIEGYKTFTEDWELMQGASALANENGVCGKGDKCCKVNGFAKVNGNDEEEEEKLFQTSEFTPYDISQEPIFPPELVESDSLDQQGLYFKSNNVEWFRPTHLNDLLDLKVKHPQAKIIVGNSEVGVEVKFKRMEYPVLIQPTSIPEMTEWKLTNKGINIGASTTLMEMEYILREQIEKLDKVKTTTFAAIVDMLHYFAGKQIRSVASVGGNIMTSSPISDLSPIFMAANIELELRSKSGTRFISMDEHFFTGYRCNVVKPDEILMSITIPFTKENQHFNAYKQARRRDDDIAIVTCAINLTLEANSNIIEDIRLGFGGMAPTTVLALKTREALRGLPWNEATLEKAYHHLMEDLPLSPSAPGGMIQYRRALPLSFLFRTFIKVNQQLATFMKDIQVSKKDLSAVDGFHYQIPKSSQYFQVVPGSQDENDPVGRPIPHLSAYKQATGEAVYCDDMPFFENELYMAFVHSTKAHARIISVNPEQALSMEGVHGYLSSKDLTKHENQYGPTVHDEEIFASDKVVCQGQIIAAIVAKDQATAQKAARKVIVEYEELQPIIVSVEDAIKLGSFHSQPKRIEIGDVDKVFAEAPNVLEGQCKTGYQEHFYLETHCVIAVPKKEDCEMEIYCSSQDPSEIMQHVAHVLGVPQNRIVVKVKRVGGGFGGKESRPTVIASPAALAARKYQRPIRVMLDRDEDMSITGGRHPFLLKYKVAFNDDGNLLGCEIHIFTNAGCTHDLSVSVLGRAMFHFENAYKIPNVRVIGRVCKTNLPSNTAFRGFGGPQGMFAGETLIRDVADYLNKDPVEVSRLNLYKEGDMTHYRQTLKHCTLQRCWDECLEKADYHQRKANSEKYNRENRWKKKGLSVVPTKFGIAFTRCFLNQAGALLLIYKDGSVLLSHGGTEMGQGLYTKMIQVASKALGIPIGRIHTSETSTDKVPNTSATAASVGSDLNGMAVLNACNTINERLKPVKEKNPTGTWEDWILTAYLERISLSATGFYRTPDIGYDWATNSGMPYSYYTYGVAVTEVEIDCLTGDHQVLRTDIVMDLGESLNPAIDIGQIEGGFIQGYGLFVLEEMMYSPTGAIFTKGPGAYKIPGFADIPIEFNVSLLKGAPNPRAVYSSKAVGEPPLFLASSVLFAIREAIKAARKESGIDSKFRLDAPATSAKIRMGCTDHLTAKLDEPKAGTYTAWNIIP